MAQSIKQLLSKKGWTGREVGRALLMSLANDVKNKGKKPLFSQEDFNRMVKSLSDAEYAQFNIFGSIYSGIVDNFNRNGAMVQQFYNGYYRYFLSIREAQRAEDFFKTMEKFPLILTQDQYDRAVAAVEAQMRDKKESYVSLFFHTLRAFLWAMDADEERAKELNIRILDVPENIRAAILATDTQPVTNQRILANWIEDNGEGYYVLPDGRRSDEMTGDEWRAALEERYMETHRLIIDGVEASPGLTARHYHQQRILRAYELLYRGSDYIRDKYEEATGKSLSDEDLEGLTAELEELADGSTQRMKKNHEELYTALIEDDVDPVWHYYDTPPDDLTKYDVLFSDCSLERYTGGYSDRLLEPGGDPVEEISARDQFKEFKRDYPELSDAIATFMENAVPATNGLKANQLYKDLVSWGTLSDLNYLDFKDLTAADDDSVVEYVSTEDTAEAINKKNRGIYHGIAILKKARYFDAAKDGSYIDPVGSKINMELLQGIDYMENDPDSADYIRETLDDLAVPALRFIYAYNAFIDILADVYDVDVLRDVKSDMSYQESQIEACNNLLFMLYNDVYGTEEDKKRKRKFIREHFHPIDLEDLKPTEETILEVKKTVSDLGYTKQAAAYLKNCEPFIKALINREEVRR